MLFRSPVASSVENLQICTRLSLELFRLLDSPLICYFFFRYVHISALDAVKVGKAIPEKTLN